MGVKRLTECREKPTVRRHANNPMRDNYSQARATASRGALRMSRWRASVVKHPRNRADEMLSP